MNKLLSILTACLLSLAAACGEQEQARWATPPGDGPTVIFDIATHPFPAIPFPNDVATCIDPTSPTGRRINVGTDGETRLERDVRRRLDGLDGFGTYQPITVAFDKPLDLDALIERHQRNLDFSDDAVYIVNIDPKSPEYGRPVLIDMGRGNFPALVMPGTTYFPSDPREQGQVLLFETAQEDIDRNGVLDPGEDTDSDGILDRPNVWPDGASIPDGLLTFYERESNTLLLRPVVPLREQSEYAVVLTRRLVGENGEPVRSPFRYVHHTQQTQQLSRLQEIFASWQGRGILLSVDDIAFAWTFTTQSVTREMVAIREGIYGYGPLGWLEEKISPETRPLPAWSTPHKPSSYVLDIGVFKLLAAAAFAPAFDITEEQVRGLLEDYDNIASIVQGSFESPNFLESGEEYPWDRAFDIDLDRGKARVTPERLYFTMAIPKTTTHFRQPFPVAIYAHGFGMARIEFLGFAGILAKYGIASIGIDAYGHGVYLPPEDVEVVMKISERLGFKPFMETLLEGRARDLDGDGKIDAGGDTFSAYAFHSRDTMRQSVIDHLQLVRVLRQWDGRTQWGLDQDQDGRGDLAGDFDGDGTVDAGGPGNPYFVWGSSMGGMHATIIGALEPSIVATAPVAGGAGLTSLASRSQQVAVCTDTVMRGLGPVIVGEPVEGAEGTMKISYVFPFAKKLRRMPIAEVSGVEPGFRVEVLNVDKGKLYRARVRADLRFNLHMRADRGDRFTVTVYDAKGDVAEHIDTWRQDVWFLPTKEPTYYAGDLLHSPEEGWGLHRGSADLRRLIGLAQTILEPGDPINYASHHFLDPLPIRPEGPTPSDLLVVVTLGDPMNPVDIHAAKARAAGILDYLNDDPRYGLTDNDWLISRWVYEGMCGLGRFPKNQDGNEVLFDPDSLDHLGKNRDNGFGAPDPASFGEPELRLKVSTPSGISGIRFGHMRPCGKHSFFITDPSNAFNIDEYLASMVGYWFATRAQVILDDGCHEDTSCRLP